MRAGTHPVNFNYTHVMTIDPKMEHGQGARVDDAQAVRLPRDKVERSVLVEPGKVGPVGSKIYQG